jgi:membrane-associated phospholipid phosphatase
VFPLAPRRGGSSLSLALLALGGSAVLGAMVAGRPATRIDRRARRLARSRAGRLAHLALAPHFPIGLPASYITIAYLAHRRMRRCGVHGSGALVAAAWFGWLSQRAGKRMYARARPLSDRAATPRFDSYPSGHATGATALSIAAARVLRRNRVLSPRAAAALWYGAPIIMGASRILDDEHWASDVVGGWLLGLAIGTASETIERLVFARGLRQGQRDA